MDFWEVLVDSEELHAYVVAQFRKVCEKFPKFLKCGKYHIGSAEGKKLRTWIYCALLLETQPTKQS